MSKPSVAVFGLHGVLGESTLAAFSDPLFSNKYQLPVLAITRDASQKTSTEYVKYVEGDISENQEILVQSLKNVDIVISLLASRPDTLGHIESIVGTVKPSVYIPSQFGGDNQASARILPGFAALKSSHSEKIRALGIKVVDIYTAFFEGGIWLHKVIGHIGADVNTNKVTYLGSPDTQFSYTSVSDIGKTVASVAHLAYSSPAHFPDIVKVQSGVLSPKQVVERYEADNGTKFDVAQIVSKEDALVQGQAVWAKGFDPSKFLYYINVLVSQGQDAGLVFNDNNNELVNPGESLWKWTKF